MRQKEYLRKYFLLEILQHSWKISNYKCRKSINVDFLQTKGCRKAGEMVQLVIKKASCPSRELEFGA